MCFSGAGDGGAAAALAQEKKRQENIKLGMANINKVFDGGVEGFGALPGSPVKGTTYYNPDGTAVTLDSRMVQNPALKDNTLPRDQRQTLPHQIEQFGTYDDAKKWNPADVTKLFTGTHSTGGGFDDGFYQNLENKYLDYARPALDDQFLNARKQLVFALARSGNLASTSAAQRQAKLDAEKARYEGDITNAAHGYSNQTRTDVENARDSLISQLTATEDPSAAAQGAVQRAAVLSRPPAFNPVGEFTFQAAQGLGPVINQATGYNGILRSPLFVSGDSSGGSGGGSVRYNN